MVVSFLGLSIGDVAAYCAVLAFMAGLAAWLKRQADKRGITPRVSEWAKEHWAYCRSWFRWHAVLTIDLNLMNATAIISARPDVVRIAGVDNNRKLVKVAHSGRLQRRTSFAWQVQRTWVEYCAAEGWNSLQFHIQNWRPCEVAATPYAWVVHFKFVDRKGCIVLQPGWSPVRPLPDKNVVDVWKEFQDNAGW